MSEPDLPGSWGVHTCPATGGGQVLRCKQQPGLEADLGVKRSAQKSLEQRLAGEHEPLHGSA